MRKVYFFVPNLIDYVRLVLNLTAFYFILSKPFLTVTLHFTGGIVLDVLDGILARYLNQCSRYGALLDGLLDRCGRVGMMMSLCVFYPQYLFVLQLLVCLTIAVGVSVHYRRFLVANPVNPGDIYSVSQSYDHWLVKIYFEDPFLTLVLAGQDLCVAMLYLLHFSPGPSVSFAGNSYSLWVLLAWIGAPFFIYSQVIVHGLLVFNSFRYLARLHDQENSKKVE